MPKRDDRPGRVGDYWLSRRPNSDSWCRTWYDARLEQTRRVSLRETDFHAAHLALVAWVLEHSRPRDAAPADILIEAAMLDYWNGHARTIASADQARIASALIAGHFAGEPVAALTVPRQESFVDALRAMGHSDGYVSRTLSVLRAALNRMHRRGEILAAPFIVDVMTQDDRDAAEPKGRPLAIEEMAALFDAAKSDHVFGFLLLGTATLQRPSAVLELTRFQIDRGHRVIDFNPPGRRQTKKHRPVVPIPETLLPWLPPPGIAADAEGRPLPPQVIHYHGRKVGSIKTAWRQLRAAAGLDARVNPYSLRHTMGRELRRRRVPADQISILLGHRPVDVKRTDLVYSPFDPDYLTDAAAAIDGYFLDLQRHTKRRLVGPAVIEEVRER